MATALKLVRAPLYLFEIFQSFKKLVERLTFVVQVALHVGFPPRSLHGQSILLQTCESSSRVFEVLLRKEVSRSFGRSLDTIVWRTEASLALSYSLVRNLRSRTGSECSVEC